MTRNSASVIHEPARPESADRPEMALGDVVQAYRRFAPVYDYVFGALLQPGRRAMTRRVSTLGCESVLEVGVGTGLTLSGYPSHTRIVGVDVCAHMLAVARRRADAMSRRDISLHLMSGERMDFDDESFDCVTVPYVLSATPNPGLLIQEMRRVCRKQGFIIVLNHFGGSAAWRPWDKALASLARWIGFRSDLGFEDHILGHDWNVESVRSVNLFGLSRLVVLRNT